MKKILLILLSLAVLSSVCFAETFSWTNPVAFQNGSPLTDSYKNMYTAVIKMKGGSETEFQAFVTRDYFNPSWSAAIPSRYAPGSVIHIQFTPTFNNGVVGNPTVVDYTVPNYPPGDITNVVIGN